MICVANKKVQRKKHNIREKDTKTSKTIAKQNELITDLQIKNIELTARCQRIEKDYMALRSEYDKVQQKNADLLTRIKKAKKNADAITPKKSAIFHLLSQSSQHAPNRFWCSAGFPSA